jgi:hypothetical protein
VQNVFKLRTALAIPLLATVLAGCDLSGEDDEVVSCDGVTTIQNSTDASIAAGDIAAAIEAAILPLPNDIYTGETFPGHNGEISINGTVDSSTVPNACGIGCDEITNSHALTAVLNIYMVAPGDAIITGTVLSYTDLTVSQLSGSVLTVISGSITIADADTDITYEATFTEPSCNPQLNGIFDTITLLSSIGSSTASSDQQGTLEAISGAFSFP